MPRTGPEGGISPNLVLVSVREEVLHPSLTVRKADHIRPDNYYISYDEAISQAVAVERIAPSEVAAPLESGKRRQIDDLWKARRASSPRSLAKVLLTPPVLDAIRLELKKQTGHNIEVGELSRLLKATIIRPEGFATDASEAAINQKGSVTTKAKKVGY